MLREAAHNGQVLNCQQFVERLDEFSRIHALKLYRLQLDAPPPVPTLPCLDHEAMLHEGISPHAAAYVEDRSGSLHEVVFIPDERKVYLDIVSTMGECAVTVTVSWSVPIRSCALTGITPEPETTSPSCVTLEKPPSEKVIE